MVEHEYVEYLSRLSYDKKILLPIDNIHFFSIIFQHRHVIIKILFPITQHPDNIIKLQQSSENEVHLQLSAAKYKLGPKIYKHKLFMANSDTILPFTICDKNGFPRLEPPQFSFYYIIMENYSPLNGWSSEIGGSSIGSLFKLQSRQFKIIPGGISNNELGYRFINKLVSKAHVVNIEDPIGHFYYHPDHGLRMIDYGSCIHSTRKDTDKYIKQMCDILQIIIPYQPPKRNQSRHQRQNKHQTQTRSRSRSRSPFRSSTRSHSTRRRSRTRNASNASRP
jgi:hypothetical protein